MYELKANVEVEKKLISALMTETDSKIGDITDILSAEDFSRPEHRSIYRTIEKMEEEGKPLSGETVRTELARRGKLKRIGEEYYDSLLKQEYTAARTEYYAGIVRERAILRSLIAIGREITDEAENERGRVEELVEAAEQKLMKVTQKASEGGLKELGTVLREAIGKVMKAQGEGAGGVPSGYVEIDKVLGGFQETEMIILAARPSVGKTALALNMAVNAGLRGKKVALVSLEMSAAQLGMRLLSMQSGINSQQLKMGNISEEEVKRLTVAAGELSELAVTIDDTAGMGLIEMRSKMRRLKRESGLDMIIIDYLQLMQGGRAENRQQEISEISRGLKGLARELRVPVMALSQLSRSVEMRAEKKPLLSDLRESGALEQDADIVLFLYREEYYNREDAAAENIAEVIIAKNRNGPTTAVRLHFNKGTMKFGNLTREVSD